ncbi:AraC family transcriptional regulator [Acuticoccus mangrovi]|uniref:AraC family transcriptional regulator n=1 Tax=Acuticoccus mangrovi TaxID=2796142 RepID=A0A934IIH4_9HYPH|nr:AraC family transcriptional regulator [Acuticoccus mangrovi]MBJ3774317.1 AraC family transcriptional regulator [Acuticoccus mangrovi]
MTLATFTERVAAFAEAHGIAGAQPFATSIAGLTVMRATEARDIAATLYHPVFCLVLQGAKELVLEDGPVRFGTGQSLIVSVDLPAISRVTEASLARPYLAVALRVDMGIIRDLAAETGIGGAAEGGASVAADTADAGAVAAMSRLFALTETPEAAPVLAPLAVREIHYWLLAAGHGGMLRDLTRADSHATRIVRTIATIRTDIARRLSIGELAAQAGMSASAFHNHFRGVTGTSPLQYQKRLRLIEARRLLMAGTHGVASSAFAVGYESPTHFSRDYSRLFGAPPRSDLARATGGGIPEGAAARPVTG